MHKYRADIPGGRFLNGAGVAAPGERGVILQELQRCGHGRVVHWTHP
jgi:hypothetical protein